MSDLFIRDKTHRPRRLSTSRAQSQIDSLHDLETSVEEEEVELDDDQLGPRKDLFGM